MKEDLEFIQRAQELIEAGRALNAWGWVPATSGNFSARLADGSIAITLSGRHKGRLTVGDFVRLDAQGRSSDGRQPSAETALHRAVYRRYPKARAVLHSHSPGSVLVSRLFKSQLVLTDYELLKALEGIKTHTHRIVVPIFQNDQDIERLARQLEAYIDCHDDLYGFILAGHGFYTWGSSVEAALRQAEALEFMLDCEVRLHGVKGR